MASVRHQQSKRIAICKKLVFCFLCQTWRATSFLPSTQPFRSEKGASINLQGERFIATEDDHLLIDSAACGDSTFSPFEAAGAEAQARK